MNISQRIEYRIKEARKIRRYNRRMKNYRNFIKSLPYLIMTAIVIYMCLMIITN